VRAFHAAGIGPFALQVGQAAVSTAHMVRGQRQAVALARHVDAAGPLLGLQLYSRSRLRTVRAYQALNRGLTPCFQCDGAGLWRDLMFASALPMPGSRDMMHRSVAAPRRCVRLA